MAFHDLLSRGMEFAHELVEGEPAHRSAALFLRRDELIEDLAIMSLFPLYPGRGRFDQLLWHVGDLGGLLGVVESGVLVDDRPGPRRWIVRCRRQVRVIVANRGSDRVTR